MTEIVDEFVRREFRGVPQCREVARFKTGMPVYTGVLGKSSVFRSFFGDFVNI